MSDKVDFTTSIDADGWRVVALSNNLRLYLRGDTASVSMEGGTWRSEAVADKPTGLSSSNYFVGIAGGVAYDTAITVGGAVRDSGAVVLSFHNSYAGTVSTTVQWWCYIFEIALA